MGGKIQERYTGWERLQVSCMFVCYVLKGMVHLQHCFENIVNNFHDTVTVNCPCPE